MDNYRKLAVANLARLFASPPDDLAVRLGGSESAGRILLPAFGNTWEISGDGVSCQNGTDSTVVELLISLYATHASAEPLVKSPFISFKELPGSMPYVGAFLNRCQLTLAPHVGRLEEQLGVVANAFDGEIEGAPESGDFACHLRPLPKICLKFICYKADEDFPASVTCLYSNNAARFLPTDALADVGEYTVRGIIDRIRNDAAGSTA